MKSSWILKILASSALLVSCGNHFELSGYKFRTNAAMTATLGGVGWKSKAGHNTFDPWVSPQLSGIPIKIIDEREMGTDLSSQFKVEGGASHSGVTGEGKVDRYKRVIRQGNYQVLSILDRELLARRIEQLPPRQLAPLKEKDGRVITSVVIVFDHSEDSERKLDIELNASVAAQLVGNSSDPKIKITSKTGRKRTIRIADGYRIGYETSRIEWNSTNPNQIKSIRPDKIGWDLWRR